MRARAMLACLPLLLGACVIDVPPLVPLDVPSSVRVTVPMAERASPDARRPFSLVAEPIPVGLEVLGPDGLLLPSFDGWLEVRVEPGEVQRIDTGVAEPAVGNHVHITGGVAAGLVVHIAKTFSDARIWVEDIGYTPADPAVAACANGLDDDGDGAADYPADSGCRFFNDDTEAPGSHASGVSDIIHFTNPSLADVQGRQALSPLSGRRVSVDAGTMILTRVTSDGFYVSEIEIDAMGAPTGAAVPWSSMFVFNFSTPPRLRACDRILAVSGSVGEFFGFTEMNFPSWRSVDWCPAGRTCTRLDGSMDVGTICPIPEPFVLGTGIIGTPTVEQFESGLVRVDSAQMPAFFGPMLPTQVGPGAWRFVGDASNCDIDGDGNVGLTRGTADRDCNDACAAEPACAEWNTFIEFGQYTVRTAGAVINVVSRDTVPGFEPNLVRDEVFASITGTLRHFSPLGPERGYMIEPRCDADLVQVGPPAAIESACIAPRTPGPDDVQ